MTTETDTKTLDYNELTDETTAEVSPLALAAIFAASAAVSFYVSSRVIKWYNENVEDDVDTHVIDTDATEN